MKILDFKTVSPLFEMERDGIKPFTCRKWAYGRDRRFLSLSQWKHRYTWGIRITNPNTGESFLRKLVGKQYMIDFTTQTAYDWVILFLGEDISPLPKRR